MIKILLNILFVIPISSFANDTPINKFIIGFWPEYDHPGVLVSIQIQSDSTEIPYNFNLVKSVAPPVNATFNEGVCFYW